MEEAVGAVGVEGLIDRLPGGLDYDVKERGVMLSTGQRQLISFVRAYAQQPGILVLDEATSSIDPESEQLIQNATARLTEHRTSILVAHRLSTIQDADRIIVMDLGQIVESGNHAELLSAKGKYSRLFEMQTDLNTPLMGKSVELSGAVRLQVIRFSRVIACGREPLSGGPTRA